MADDDTKALISALKKTANPAKGTVLNSEWARWPITMLSNDLADQLDIGTATATPKYNSVPDIWAGVSTFAMALLDSQTPPTEAVTLWRGLFAIWALKDALQLDVEIVPVELAKAERGRRFLRAASRLAPDQVTLPGDGWDRVAIMTLGQKPLAILNPMTLFAPTAEYRDAVRGHVEWFDNHKDGFVDLATALPAISHPFVRQAARDVGTDLERIASTGTRPGPRYTNLSERLRDLEAAMNQYGTTRAIVTRRGPIDERAGVVMTLANLSFAPDPDAPVTVAGPFVPVRPEFVSTGLKGLIIADAAIANGRDPGLVPFWDNYSLKDVLERGRFEDVRKAAAAQGYVVVRGDELFAPVLAVVADTPTITSQGENNKAVLPLNPLVLAFASPADLKRNCRIIDVQGRPTRCELTLQFSERGQQAPMTLFKVFEGPARKPMPAPYTCGLWPNFRMEGWNYYTLLTRANRDETMLPAYLIGPELLARTITGIDRPRMGGELATRLRELRLGKRRIVDRKLLTLKQLDQQNWLEAISEPPEALAIDINLNAQRGSSYAPDIKPAGFVLMPELEEDRAAPGERRTVGIDFGTSNTVAYVRSEQGEPRLLTLRADIATPFSNCVLSENLPMSDHTVYGVAGVAIEKPYQTILEERREQGGTPDERRAVGGQLADGATAPNWTHRVMFNSNLRLSLDTFNGDSGLVHFGRDMKWGMSARDHESAKRTTDKVTVFLKQTVLMALAEMAREGVSPANVTFSFSFPEAFGEEDRRTFQRLCHNAIEDPFDAERLFGAAASSPRGIAKPKMLDESRAAAAFFAHASKAFFNETVIVLDVGGGTTDIVISRGKKVLWHASVRLAGQDMFSRPMVTSGVMAEALKSNTSMAHALAALEKNIGDKKHLAAELIINAPEFPAVLNDLSRIAGSPLLQTLKGSIALALGGLLHYIGTVLHSALSEAERAEFGSRPIYFCFGGKGSGIFRDFLLHEEELKGLFRDAAGLPDATIGDFIFSDRPKHEVAYGLTASMPRDEELDWKTDLLSPLGIALSGQGGQKLSSTDTYASAIGVASLSIPPGETAFDVFLKKFSQKVIAVDLSLDDASSMRSEANKAIENELRAIQTLDAEGETSEREKRYRTLLACQPPFILLLRAAIARLTAAGTKSRLRPH